MSHVSRPTPSGCLGLQLRKECESLRQQVARLTAMMPDDNGEFKALKNALDTAEQVGSVWGSAVLCRWQQSLQLCACVSGGSGTIACIAHGRCRGVKRARTAAAMC